MNSIRPSVSYTRSLKTQGDKFMQSYRDTRLEAYLTIAECEINHAAYMGANLVTVYCPGDINRQFTEALTEAGFTVQRIDCYNHYRVNINLLTHDDATAKALTAELIGKEEH